MVFSYLAAIIAANLIVTWLGAWVTPYTAFFLIGLDITTRDYLHDKWQRRGLWWKMGLLIASGSVISWVLNAAAWRIALASFIAFAVSSIIDALVYQFVKADKIRRVNWSNLASALVDSVLFPTIAFGWPPMLEIIYGQFAAKVAGGLFWSLIITRKQERPTTLCDSCRAEFDADERAAWEVEATS